MEALAGLPTSGKLYPPIWLNGWWPYGLSYSVFSMILQMGCLALYRKFLTTYTTTSENVKRTRGKNCLTIHSRVFCSPLAHLSLIRLLKFSSIEILLTALTATGILLPPSIPSQSAYRYGLSVSLVDGSANKCTSPLVGVFKSLGFPITGVWILFDLSRNLICVAIWEVTFGICVRHVPWLEHWSLCFCQRQFLLRNWSKRGTDHFRYLHLSTIPHNDE